jgi:predicted Ser/Thr protein kinase
MIGKVINNYLLERKLGDGGMGDVYLGRHNKVDRLVAIKILHHNLFANESIRARFKNEANALIKLEHPHIVRIYDYVEQENLACLVMEYIDGVTLDEYINRYTGPIPAARAVNIMSAVLDAVQYAHDRKIFHRDIKPGNIMITRDGKMVRIMDFGIAKFSDGYKLDITHANTQLGTPFYMSPEQVKGLPYSAQSDIYSLGVTLFEMSTGKCPYTGITNLFELQNKIVNEPLPATFKFYPDVTPRIQKAISIATNKNPEQRFKTSQEFKRFLLFKDDPLPVNVIVPVHDEQPAKKPRVEKVPKPVKRKTNRNAGLAIGVIVTLMIVAFLAWNSWKKNKKEDLTSGTVPEQTAGQTVVTPDSTTVKPQPPQDQQALSDLATHGMGDRPFPSSRSDIGSSIVDSAGYWTYNLTFSIPGNDTVFLTRAIYELTGGTYAFQSSEYRILSVPIVTEVTKTPPPPAPTQEKVRKDLLNQQLSNGLLFTESSQIQSYSPNRTAQGWNGYSTSFFLKNAGDTNTYFVRVLYKAEGGEFVYSGNNCSKVIAKPVAKPITKVTTDNSKPPASQPGSDAIKAFLVSKLASRGELCETSYSSKDEIEVLKPEPGKRADDGSTITYKVPIKVNGMPCSCKVISVSNDGINYELSYISRY